MRKRLIKIVIIILLIVVLIGAIRIWSYRKSFVYLSPASPSGVQLVAQTSNDMRAAYSTIYIKYPDRKDLVKTDVVIIEDEGPALGNSESNSRRLNIEWIDDNHVSLLFRIRNSYYNDSPIVIEY